MFKEYFDINISENIETIIVYLYESGEQQKNSDLSLKWPKKYRLYHKCLSVHGLIREAFKNNKRLTLRSREGKNALFITL